MIPFRKNSDLIYLFLHHTESASSTEGSVINSQYTNDGQFGAPYDIIINKNGKIDLTPRWIYASEASQYESDVSVNKILKYKVHHFSAGAEQYDYNKKAVHIALVGNFDDVVPSAFQMNSLVDVLVEFILELGIDVLPNLIYHSDVTNTTCPGYKIDKNALRLKVLSKLRLAADVPGGGGCPGPALPISPFGSGGGGGFDLDNPEFIWFSPGSVGVPYGPAYNYRFRLFYLTFPIVDITLSGPTGPIVGDDGSKPSKMIPTYWSLSWSSDTSAGYHLKVSTKADFSGILLVDQDIPGTTPGSLSPNTPYMWTLIPDNPVGLGPEAEVPFMIFASPSSVGISSMTGMQNTGNFVIVSSDAFDSWDYHELGYGAWGAGHAIACSAKDFEHIWVLLSNYANINSVYYTSDGGANWGNSDLSFTYYTPLGGRPYDLRDIHMHSDGLTGWIAGEVEDPDTEIRWIGMWKTIDGGVTWNVIQEWNDGSYYRYFKTFFDENNDPDPDATTIYIIFTTSSTNYVTQLSTSYASSTDGGNNWTLTAWQSLPLNNVSSNMPYDVKGWTHTSYMSSLDHLKYYNPDWWILDTEFTSRFGGDWYQHGCALGAGNLFIAKTISFTKSMTNGWGWAPDLSHPPDPPVLGMGGTAPVTTWSHSWGIEQVGGGTEVMGTTSGVFAATTWTSDMGGPPEYHGTAAMHWFTYDYYLPDPWINWGWVPYVGNSEIEWGRWDSLTFVNMGYNILITMNEAGEGLLLEGGGSLYVKETAGGVWSVRNWPSAGMPNNTPIGIANKDTAFLTYNSNVLPDVGNIGMVVTKDGANTWTVPLRDGIFYGLWLLYTDKQIGWCCGEGSGIRRTINAGLTWPTLQARTAGAPTYYGIAFYNSGIGWVVGEGGVIKMSLDGGTTWNDDFSGVGVDLKTVFPMFSDRAYAAGVGGTILVRDWAPGSGWSSQTSGVGDTINGIAFAPASGLVGWAVTSGGDVLYTNDGGSNWTTQASLGAVIYGLFVGDVNHAWVVGAGGLIYYTANGGVNWDPQASGVATDLYGISFHSDGLSGWTVGDTTIRQTTDGGTTWIENITTNPTGILSISKLRMVGVVNPMVASTVGYTESGAITGGVIYNTTNSGTTWNVAGSTIAHLYYPRGSEVRPV